MKVKSESEVAQSCLTLCGPMDCSPPGSSLHGIFQARVLEWGAIAFSGKCSDQESNPDPLFQTFMLNVYIILNVMRKSLSPQGLIHRNSLKKCLKFWSLEFSGIIPDFLSS